MAKSAKDKSPRKPAVNEKIRAVLARNLRALLEANELSENALARRCQVSQRQINNLTNARTGCSTDVLCEIAGVFGVEPWILLLEDMPRIIQNPLRLERLAHTYTRADDGDRDLIDQIARKMSPST
jgi:transcriptional regulator with XRE-family HTH domain